MTLSLPGQRETRAGGVLELAEHYSAVRSRLMDAQAPPPKPHRERPVSPFAPARRPRPEPGERPAMPQMPTAPWRVIVAKVAAKHSVRVSDILGQCRERWLMPARHEAVFRVFTETRLSTIEIGKRLGDRDHTTVLNSLKWMTKTNPGAAEALEAARHRRKMAAKGERRRLARRAQELWAGGMLKKDILAVLPISQSALFQALCRPSVRK